MVHLGGREEEPVHDGGLKQTYRQPMNAAASCWATGRVVVLISQNVRHPSRSKGRMTPKKHLYLKIWKHTDWTTSKRTKYYIPQTANHWQEGPAQKTNAPPWFSTKILQDLRKQLRTLLWMSNIFRNRHNEQSEQNRQGAGRKRASDMKNGDCN